MTDAELIVASCRDPGAFRTLYDRWAEKLLAYFYQRVFDAEVAADLLADGGDCLSDLAVLRQQPELFGVVASTPTAWRVIERVAGDPDGLAGLRAARAHARLAAWRAGADPDGLLVIGVDGTLVGAHSDKQGAAGTYKGGFGFYPLVCYLD